MPLNENKDWTGEECELLKSLWEQGRSASQVAGRLNRTAGAIRAKGRKLGCPFSRKSVETTPSPPSDPLTRLEFYKGSHPIKRREDRDIVWTDELKNIVLECLAAGYATTMLAHALSTTKKAIYKMVGNTKKKTKGEGFFYPCDEESDEEIKITFEPRNIPKEDHLCRLKDLYDHMTLEGDWKGAFEVAERIFNLETEDA